MLSERTEGWAAELRLAVLSLAGHPYPGRFAAEFSGSERTVAEYLLAQVLERGQQPTRHLFAKLGVHCRSEATAHARAVGLLVPFPACPEVCSP